MPSNLTGSIMYRIGLLFRYLAPASLMAVLALWISAMATPVVAAELVMIDRQGCAYCIAWKKEVGTAYPNTDLGAFAPLRIVDIREGAPNDVSFSRPAMFTPTFILIEQGVEIGRIEGYPGEDFFWGLLEKMLKEKTDFVGSS